MKRVLATILSGSLLLMPAVATLSMAGAVPAAAKGGGKGHAKGGGHGKGHAAASHKSKGHKSKGHKPKRQAAKGHDAKALGRDGHKPKQHEDNGHKSAGKDGRGAVAAIRAPAQVIEVRGRSFDLDAIRALALGLGALNLVRTLPESAEPSDAPPTPVYSYDYAPDAPLPPEASRRLEGLDADRASLEALKTAEPDTRLGHVAAYRQALLDYRAELNDPDRQAREESYVRSLIDFAPEGTDAAAIADTMRALYALNDGDAHYRRVDEAAILSRLNPGATEAELAAQVDALPGIVESDDALARLRDERDSALTVALDGRTLTPGTPAWDAFHRMLRLDQTLTDAELQELDDHPFAARSNLPSIDAAFDAAMSDPDWQGLGPASE